MATYTTAAGAETGLLANLDFEETASVSKAKSVVSAGKAWLVLRPDSASDQSSSLTLNSEKVETMIKDARRYINGNATATAGNSKVVHLSVEDFRS